MRISDWSSDVCSSDLSTLARSFSETPLGVGESCPVNMAAPAMPATPAMPAAPAAAPVKQEVAAAPTPQSAADALAAAAVAMQAAASAMKRSEEHTSELQSLMRISYAVFCLKKKNRKNTTNEKHI